VPTTRWRRPRPSASPEAKRLSLRASEPAPPRTTRCLSSEPLPQSLRRGSLKASASEPLRRRAGGASQRSGHGARPRSEATPSPTLPGAPARPGQSAARTALTGRTRPWLSTWRRAAVPVGRLRGLLKRGLRLVAPAAAGVAAALQRGARLLGQRLRVDARLRALRHAVEHAVEPVVVVCGGVEVAAPAVVSWLRWWRWLRCASTTTTAGAAAITTTTTTTTTTAAAAAATTTTVTNLGAAVKKASLLSEGRSLATEATPASIADSFRAQLADSSDAYSAARCSSIVGIVGSSALSARAPQECLSYLSTKVLRVLKRKESMPLLC